MKIRTKLIFSLAVFLLCAFFGGNTAEAGTYTVGNYTFTVTHCNTYGKCHDPSYQEAKDTLAYALAAHKSTYTKTLACGNTVTLVLKSCKVTNVCSKGNAVNLNAKCKRTTTACACGCANGFCNDCGNDDGDDDGGGTPVCTGASCNPTSCTEDIWSYGDWSSCVDGVQTRSAIKVFECPSTDTAPEATTRSCTGVLPPGGEDVLPACTYPADDGSCPPPEIKFSSNPKLISKGGSCVLRWEVEGAETCEIQGESVGPQKGNRPVSPDETSIYKISCVNGPSSASKVAVCSVQDVSEQ